MRILLTNDDGVHAPGLLALKIALSAVGEVLVAAPDRQRSAAGHAITLHKPLRLNTVRLADGSDVQSVSGTPADCVSIGIELMMDNECDLVVSGINSGANLGWDVSYSGTVAAAMEGAILGRPAIAVSLVTEYRLDGQYDYTAAARFAAELARQIVQSPLPPYTFLNVNVPDVPAGTELRAVVTHLGKREYMERMETRIDPKGVAYFWQGGDVMDDNPEPGTDVHAVHQGNISVTPLHLDMTAYKSMGTLTAWPLFRESAACS